MRLAAYLRGDLRVEGVRARYAIGIATLVGALVLRLVLTPLTGWGAPFVLFFGATLVTSLVAGVGPAILSVLISLPISGTLFVVQGGYPVSEAVSQSILYALDGLLVIYMTRRIHEGRASLQASNREMQRSSAERTRMLSEARRIAHEREEALADEQLARRQAESANEQLRESEERFRLTIEDAPIGMALVALDGRFVRVNQALCEITGYNANELTKLTFQDITHPDDLRNDVEAARRLAAGDIPRYHLEKRYIRKDGSVVDILLSVSVMRHPDGGARYYISQIQDITERKRAETALRLSEAKFSAIISIAADAIISVDRNERITIFNEGAQRIFGYEKDEAIGMELEQLIPDRLRAVHRRQFATFAASKESARSMGLRREVVGLRKNGEEFPAEASISKVSVGGTSFFSVVLRDVTHRKNVERALQRAVTARDDVLGIVAHDLRNPLNTIIMQASLLERPEPQPDRRDPAPRLIITRSARRMNHLIQDLLDVTAIEAGKLRVDRAWIPVADLVHDAVDTQAALAASTGLELDVDIAADVRDVWGDRNRLQQVFENLIGNALKFTKTGGRITVGAVARGSDVEFWVADTGSGIAPEAVPHIFDRFWQAAVRTKRLGAGLGLPITKGIIEAHGGRIWVESALGRGTTFFFTIPGPQGETARTHEASRPPVPAA